MTVHGTGRASLENAVNRAIRRGYMKKRIDSFAAKQRKHARKTEAYAKVVEENKRLGLTLQPRLEEHQRVIRQTQHLNRGQKRKVTLAGVEPERPKVDERTEAEQSAIAGVQRCIEILGFHVSVLSQIPNPSPSYRNQIQQRALYDLIEKLARTTLPPLTVGVNQPVVRSRGRVCIGCGEPACVIQNDEWYCEHCA